MLSVRGFHAHSFTREPDVSGCQPAADAVPSTDINPTREAAT